VRFAVLILVAAALVVPASAQAAPSLDVELERESVRYGASHRVEGELKDGPLPLAGQEVVLEGRRYPYQGSYRRLGRTTTAADGSFSFREKLDRNHRLRVVATALNLRSDMLNAYTLPEFELSFRAVRPGVVRLYQRYTVPRRVRLSAPTLFYLGPRGARRASRRVVADLDRTRAGRYTSRATIWLPADWDGAFRYASCFRVSPRSGMGDPDQGCPRLRLEF
jgi:hypothetical protein